jgi:hypothetical protein
MLRDILFLSIISFSKINWFVFSFNLIAHSDQVKIFATVDGRGSRQGAARQKEEAKREANKSEEEQETHLAQCILY